MSRLWLTSSVRAVWHCEYVGVKHALAVSAGLAALQRTLCYHFCPSRYNGVYAVWCHQQGVDMSLSHITANENVSCEQRLRRLSTHGSLISIC